MRQPGFILLLGALILGACTAAAPQTSAAPTPLPPVVKPAQTQVIPLPPTPSATSPTAAAQATQAVMPTASQPPAAAGPYSEFPLGDGLVIVFAQDLMTVSAAQFSLQGQAPPGTVISINEQFAVVDESQAFAFPLALEEGPNLVEIVASNASGQEAVFEIVLIYDPAP
jgi:hypothetical protein